MGAVRLRNLLGPVHLYAPPDSPTSLPVDAGQVVTVAGPLEEADDAYLCGEGDQVRAFPKSRWQVEKTPQRTKQADQDTVSEKGGGS
ncbi:hypothetical protein [Streptomyces beihaiensis]|uniref:Uncharacterized protein n=1 Tax=Streptomyces beihaiensis TaxID=2984495 RepID=A0ABT3U4E3_9ACTN|nr:hypothetical protein [Streptomyces beihaiensis]MCX3064205.1 hypothetical protein [Streptomyces beihaiensis]